jgi:hypothetical protein
MNDAPDDAISFHLAQLLNQHLFGHSGDRAAQLGKAPDVSAEEMEQDHELPSAFENAQHALDAFRGGLDRVFLLTFR